MKKYIKLLVLVVSILIVFFTYKIFEDKNNKIYYIALGDSLAQGMNPYGTVGYGYTDYISDYLESKNLLAFYTKGFAISGYTTDDVKNDIENNKTIEVDDTKLSIKKALRESDLVTLSIGANDFLRGLSFSNFDTKLEDIKGSKKEIDAIGFKVRDLINLINDYAKGKIILVGYYNPLPRLSVIKDEIDELVKYANIVYEDICDDLNIICVDVFPSFDNREDYLPNPLDIHPNTKGYERIADLVIEKIGGR